ncbi:MAG TPA: DUF445 domain-containing protein [Gemmatimonadaceae bacterium]|nr:DUF445 domain-containing protein [Gemmatimonadaceae bacterium]
MEDATATVAGPVQPAPVPDEAQRKRRLESMKRRATSLLVAATVVFVITHLLESRYAWLGYIRAMAEAAMVGGLADWFAVTALFRHPLGIPIPHTAIVPNRKDRVGKTLGAFVQRNFLTREVIEGRLRSLHVAERLAGWIAQPENARTIARQTAVALSAGAQVLKDDDVQALIDHNLQQRIRRLRIAPLAGRLLSVVTENNRHQELLNEAIVLVARAVEDNHDLIRDRVERESPWWVPTAVDRKIYEKIVSSIERTLVEIRDDAEHPLRQRFDTALRDFIERLQTSPETATRAEALKLELIDADAVRRFSDSLWTDTKAALLRAAENPETTSRTGGSIERALTAFGDAVLADPDLVAKVDDFVTDIAVFLVARYQDDVADLISHTVQSWDPEVTTQRIELAIGGDLQYIRINGTLVGALAGLLIYTISKFF